VVAQVVRHEEGRDRLLASDGDPTAPHGRVLSLWIDDERLTSLRAAPPPGREVSRDRRNALDLIVRQAAVALANRRLLDDLRSLTEQLDHQATHDALTGLPNRTRLSRHLAELDDEGRQVAFLFCDLDGFKPVNDRLGHDAGDELLVAIADRLRSCVRDRAMVARLGGDEFTVALPDTDATTAVAVAEELTLTLSQPVALAGGVVRVGVSIGVAHNLGMLAPSELMRRADVAMYRAKAAGRGTVRLYRAEMESSGDVTSGGTEPPAPHPTADGRWSS
jgi:diguanylate cyclase (GGDEF)-like protein